MYKFYTKALIYNIHSFSRMVLDGFNLLQIYLMVCFQILIDLAFLGKGVRQGNTISQIKLLGPFQELGIEQS